MEAVASQYALRGVRKLEAEQGSCCIISYIVKDICRESIKILGHHDQWKQEVD
jgi:hypothetical protein